MACDWCYTKNPQTIVMQNATSISHHTLFNDARSHKTNESQLQMASYLFKIEFIFSLILFIRTTLKMNLDLTSSNVLVCQYKVCV